MGKAYSTISQILQMADKKGKAGQDDQQPSYHYRLTITCKEVKAIEEVTKTLIAKAKERFEQNPNLKVKGPRRMPTKVLRLTVRKSPCGNGTNTFDKFEMRIHKRVIDFSCTRTDLQTITKIEIGAGIIIEANELE